MTFGWSVETRKRADGDHARKKRARDQLQHLRKIKSERQLRQIVLGGRQKQRRQQ